jgi:hypothetical protein
LTKNRRKTNKKNLFEFAAKNKEKKKTRQITLLLTHFDEKKCSPALFFFSCDRRLETYLTEVLKTQQYNNFFERKKKKHEKNITKH